MLIKCSWNYDFEVIVSFEDKHTFLYYYVMLFVRKMFTN